MVVHAELNLGVGVQSTYQFIRGIGIDKSDIYLTPAVSIVHRKTIDAVWPS